uniref:Transcriptional coactivator Hfi1/Transcriptional adapter 1 n=1 Tax=Kalanchoe fedtschenkoi TaxID=63787 RepID=A0A7N0UKW3_KALFE
MSEDQLASCASTADMKSEIQRRVGVKHADHYFLILGRFLSSKMSKSNFDRLCIRLIGRENLSLHNRFIYTILKNARLAQECQVKKRRVVGPLSLHLDDGYQGSCLQSLCKDGFPVSPRRERTPTPRGRKFRDKLSPLGPLGKTPNVLSEDSPSKVLEQPGATELLSPGSRPPPEINSVEDGEEVEQTAGSPGVRSRSPITAPFGICINGRRSKKLLSNDSSPGIFTDTCLYLGELPDTNSLRQRMEKKVKAEGLDVSMDFINCLNYGIDIFLKRLISPTLEMARSKSKKAVHQQELSRMVPGLNVIWPTPYPNKPIESVTASALDFRVALELNPAILGDDWPILLENISFQASEDT